MKLFNKNNNDSITIASINYNEQWGLLNITNVRGEVEKPPQFLVDELNEIGAYAFKTKYDLHEPTINSLNKKLDYIIKLLSLDDCSKIIYLKNKEYYDKI